MPEPLEVTAFERASAPWLLRLHSAPRWLVAAVLAAILVAGLLLDGLVGAGLLMIIALFLGWLAALGWRRLSGSARILRVLTVGMVVAAALARTV